MTDSNVTRGELSTEILTEIIFPHHPTASGSLFFLSLKDLPLLDSASETNSLSLYSNEFVKWYLNIEVRNRNVTEPITVTFKPETQITLTF